jgi:hypothetical protein
MDIETAHDILHKTCSRCNVETILLRAWMDRDGRTIHASIYTLKTSPDDLAPRLAKKGLQVHRVTTVDRDTFRFDMVATL